MNTEKLEQAIRGIRERADMVEEIGGAHAARGLRWAADEFETALNAWENEALTPGDAAEECSWEASTIAKKLREGELPQAGRQGAPRVRRSDLFKGSPETEVDQVVSEALGLTG